MISSVAESSRLVMTPQESENLANRWETAYKVSGAACAVFTTFAGVGLIASVFDSNWVTFTVTGGLALFAGVSYFIRREAHSKVVEYRFPDEVQVINQRGI